MNTTIKEIARLAGVSRGTVDRVLHNRPGVNPEVKDRVLKILQKVEYRPNLAGKALVHTNQKYKIGVVLSPDFNPFVEEVKKGIQEEAAKISSFGVELNIEVIRAFDSEEQLAILNSFSDKGVSAIAIVPVDDKIIREKIDSIVVRGVPVVTFNSDLQGSRRLCFVGQDNYRAGKTHGALASALLRRTKHAKILIITSTFHLACHKERVGGFVDKLSETTMELVACEENSDKDETSFDITRRYLEEYEDLSLIYLTGGGISGVGRALSMKGMEGKVHVLCHDLIPESRLFLEKNIIDFVIGQDPHSQGALPIRILYEFLFLKKRPKKEFFHTRIEIFTSENCPLLE